MEQENLSTEESQIVKTSKLNTVTPLSKYFAMGLFVVMPFIGGWIGYTYAPEKIVEVEKVVIKEIPTESPNWTEPKESAPQDIPEELSTQIDFEERTGEFTGYYISLEMNPDEVNGYLEEGETVSCDAFVITEGATNILQTFGDDKSLIPTSITRLTDTILISKHVVSEDDMQKLKESSKSNQVNVSITEVFEGDRGVDTCEATIESLEVL